MNVSRLVSFAAALVITAIEGAAVSSLPLQTQSVWAVAAPVVSDASNAALPVIVVTARRHS
jgi:hypothetical protein